MTSSTVLDRESIYTRVFAYFTALTDGHAVTPLFRSATRKPGTWENYSPEECPALLMRETREQARREKFRPTVWTLYIDLLIFINTGAHFDKDVVPPVVVNPLVDAVTRVFEIDDPQTGECTLGGIVTSAAIDGTIHKYLSNTGDEAVVVVPIRILVTR
jgi:hypothetical protein